jgi:hypothetical protein
MNQQDGAAPRRQAEARPFQFTLRTMFIVTTAVAVALGGLSTPLRGVQGATLLYLALVAPMMATIGLIYGRGYMRTFSIGAMFPAGLVLFYAFVFVMDDIGPPRRFWEDQAPHREIVPVVAFVLAIIVLTGLLAMGIRWMVESPQREAAREDKK